MQWKWAYVAPLIFENIKQGKSLPTECSSVSRCISLTSMKIFLCSFCGGREEQRETPWSYLPVSFLFFFQHCFFSSVSLTKGDLKDANRFIRTVFLCSVSLTKGDLKDANRFIRTDSPARTFLHFTFCTCGIKTISQLSARAFYLCELFLKNISKKDTDIFSNQVAEPYFSSA